MTKGSLGPSERWLPYRGSLEALWEFLYSAIGLFSLELFLFACSPRTSLFRNPASDLLAMVEGRGRYEEKDAKQAGEVF